MHGKVGGRPSSFEGRDDAHVAPLQAVGKRTLIEALATPESADGIPVQRKASGEAPHEAVVQRTPAASGASSGPGIVPPKAGIDKVGFIDQSDGANIRTGPVESGGKALRDRPLPPATRVFVSGTHPDAPQWWYVTAYFDNAIVRGYVQDVRINIDLPEPLAELHQIASGETAELFAKQKFGGRSPMAMTSATTRTSSST